jgi:hypothetical protein
MHYKTYERYLREYQWLTGYVNLSIAHRFGFAARVLGLNEHGRKK